MSDPERSLPTDAGSPEQRTEPEGRPSVNPEHLRALSEMGIPEALAEKALLVTGGQSLEAAAAWYFDSGEEIVGSYTDEVSEAQMLQALHDTRPAQQLVACSGSGLLGSSGRIKMVFVVNEELTMGKGKMAAQVAHACLGLYRTLLEDRTRHGRCLALWQSQGETKVVLGGSNVEQLLDLQKRASFALLPSHLIQDAGRTQVPAGSYSVLSIFGEEGQVDQITGSLRLL